MQQKSIGEVILSTWHRCQHLPGGKWLFSWIIGKRVPYSSSINATVLKLQPGKVQVGLADRKKVRNHLNSIHAVALVNLGEMACGLALLCSLPKNVRGIVTNIDIQYVKKARGYLLADGQVDIPEINQDTDVIAHSRITDSSNDVVAKVQVVWRLGLHPESQQ